eukprot:1889712-Prymnesium_polylepis.1
MVSAVYCELTYNVGASNVIAETVLRQGPYLKAQLAALEAGDESAERVVSALDALRATLLAPQRMQLFVAADLRKLPAAPYAALATALAPPADFLSAAGVAAAAAPSAAGEGFFTAVTAHNVRSHATGATVVAALSAIESSYLQLSSEGVRAYSPDHAPLLVAIEYLTALEGDFWVKLRGAGLTYSYTLRNSTESGLLRFGLSRCTDMLGAYQAARQIVIDYADGSTSLSPIGLAASKSSLAYSIIKDSDTRLAAALGAWSGSYDGKQVDYDRWLLKEIDGVGADDVLHALKVYVLPLFDAGSSNLVVTCPTNKLDAVGDGLEEERGAIVRRLTEEGLHAAFSGDEASKPAKVPNGTGKAPRTMPFAFAKQFKCECPKCGPGVSKGGKV